MSLHTALQAIGIFIIGILLLGAFLEMGPLAWIIFGTMIVLGVLQVQRQRSRRAGEDDTTYCANCGTEVDFEIFDGNDDEDSWDVAYCTRCGAPVDPEISSGAVSGPVNCRDCGSPNDPDDQRCRYCEAPL